MLGSPGFIDILVRAMKPLFCSKDDCIVSEGEQGAEMYFLTRGRVEVLHIGTRTDGHAKVAELEPGAYFGEIALLDQTIPGVPVRAKGSRPRFAARALLDARS